MRIRFLVSIASASWSYAPDDEADVPEHEARAFVAGGIAVPVMDLMPESAALATPERAMRPSAKRGRA